MRSVFTFLTLALLLSPGAVFAQGSTCTDPSLAAVAFSNDGEVLLVDPFTGASTLIGAGAGSSLLSGVTAVTSAPEDGALYLVTGDGDDSLYKFDLATGATDLVGALTNGASNVQAMDVAPQAAVDHGFEAGAIYGVSIDGVMDCWGNCLYKIRRSSGEAQKVAGLPVSQVRGASFDPFTGELWLWDAGGNNVYTVDGLGNVTWRFAVPGFNWSDKTGASTVFSLGHSPQGTMYGIDISHGVLLEIDPATQQAYWVVDAQGSVAYNGNWNIQALDALCTGPQLPCEPMAERHVGDGYEPPANRIVVYSDKADVTLTVLRGETTQQHNTIVLPDGRSYDVSSTDEGTRFNLGKLPAGSQLALSMLTPWGDQYVTGDGAQNLDGMVHANIVPNAVEGGPLFVGFEEDWYIGDGDYDDAVLQICGDVAVVDCDGYNLYGVFHNQDGDMVISDVFTGDTNPLHVAGSDVVAATMGVTTITANSLDNSLLFVTGDGDDSLYRVDLDTGLVTLVGPLSHDASNIQAMDIAPPAAAAYGFTPGMIYGISLDQMNGCGPNCLFEIDPATGDAIFLGNVATTQGRGLSFNPRSGELWVIDAGNRRLSTVDASGTLTTQFTIPQSDFAHQTGASTVFSLAHNCEGRLFAADVAFGTLIEIDVAAQQAHWVSEYGELQGPYGSFEMHGLDGGFGLPGVPGDPPPPPPPGDDDDDDDDDDPTDL